jgi:hypothetical protein
MLELFERQKLDALLRGEARHGPLARCNRAGFAQRSALPRKPTRRTDEVENELLSLKFHVKYFESNQGYGVGRRHSAQPGRHRLARP